MTNENNINVDLMVKHMSEKIAQLSRENALLYAIAATAKEKTIDLEEQIKALESED